MAKEEKKAPKLRFNGYTNDWERKKLGILITRVKSYPLSRSVEVKKETDVKYVHYGDIHTNIADEIDKNNNLPFINEIYKEYDELKLDDVIVADASEDYKSIADAAVIISNLPYTIIAGLHTIALRPTSLIKGYFLYHIFKTENFKRFGYKIGTGLKVFGISYNNLAKYKVYYPQEIEEQEKIIGILSNLTNSINLHERKCEELALIKKALLQKLFPKKDEIKPEVRYKNFSDAWEQRKLGEVMDVGSVKRIHQSDWKTEGVRFLRARDIVSFSKNEKPSDPLYIDNSKYNEYSKISGKVQKGDLLVTGVGSIGVPMLIKSDDPIYFKDGNIIWFKNNNSLNGNFFYYSFTSNKIQNFIRKSSGAGTVGTYTIDNGKKTPILIPKDIDEQEKVGKFLSRFDALITLHQRKLEKLKQLKKFLLQNMFI